MMGMTIERSGTDGMTISTGWKSHACPSQRHVRETEFRTGRYRSELRNENPHFQRRIHRFVVPAGRPG
jgi:hypothetical protein